MNKKLLQSIRAKLKERLQERTNWGRNDLMALYDEAVADALVELLDIKEDL